MHRTIVHGLFETMANFYKKYRSTIFMLSGIAFAHVGWLLMQYNEKLVSPEDRKKIPFGLGNISYLERTKSSQADK